MAHTWMTERKANLSEKVILLLLEEHHLPPNPPDHHSSYITPV